MSKSDASAAEGFSRRLRRRATEMILRPGGPCAPRAAALILAGAGVVMFMAWLPVEAAAAAMIAAAAAVGMLR